MRKILLAAISIIVSCILIGSSLTSIALESQIKSESDSESESDQVIKTEEPISSSISSPTEETKNVEIVSIESEFTQEVETLSSNEKTSQEFDIIYSEETLQALEKDAGEPCSPCIDLIEEAFENGSTYIENNMPEFNFDDWETLYIFEYLLTVRDVFAVGIAIVMAQIGIHFLPYADDTITIGLSTFANELLVNQKHMLTALGLAIIAMINFLIDICMNVIQNQPASGPANIETTTIEGTTSTEYMASTQYTASGSASL